jgi:hypothetical protein
MASAGQEFGRRVRTFERGLARDKTPTRPQIRWSGLRRAPFFELGPDLETPLLDHHFIALGGALNRHLGSPVQAFQ